MTIAGQLNITASDDPRFKAGDSIGIVLDPSVVVTVTQNVEVSAPVAVAATSTDSAATTDEVAGEVDSSTELAETSTPPATP